MCGEKGCHVISRQPKFSNEFKPQVVEELISVLSAPAHITRRHEISAGLLYYRKQQYLKNLFF
mgnify:CR=1 FL=1